MNWRRAWSALFLSFWSSAAAVQVTRHSWGWAAVDVLIGGFHFSRVVEDR